ncbi:MULTISPECIES: DUF1778 domain-containing protein [unclassified Neisseria]|uniref:type II toxin-antitoxin system TacA family antitoxin n=1 Tax=unclassified Neisseria TaxID=2623750 RepID=UPI0026652BCF|nr:MULTISPECIES: DUF1778 domain-containing protein [unclassified Neisseria]MDO1509535.1 DUF1778 domain-containing protein [Neisseria sp. MVDL19-042950]MDO1515693.1 DUF1778 domain-containing protein [Neisseria sp. MVDL18-041461]MDO1563483.1 DUF1778 domain-containing protein [Neisseria sp. MVDL20-010259]
MAAATARFEARVNRDTHALLKRAAELEGRSLSDFVIRAAQEAARKTIAEAEILNLSLADQTAFAAALLNPPQPNTALQRALEQHNRLIGHD